MSDSSLLSSLAGSVSHTLSFDLSALEDSTLLTETERAASRDKQTTLEVLDYLAEVDRRRLYAGLGFSSLFEYVHRGLGYSESQTAERVSAMRLMRRIPEVKEAIRTEKLTLTSVAKLAAHVNRENADTNSALSLLKKCEGKTTREVERILVDHVTKMLPRPDRAKAVSRELTQVVFDADQELIALIRRAKELNGDPSFPLNEIFKDAIQEYVRRREAKRGMGMPTRKEARKSSDIQSEMESENCVRGMVNDVSRRGEESQGDVKHQKTEGRAENQASQAEEQRSFLRTVSSAPQVNVKSASFGRIYLSLDQRRLLFKRAENKCQYFNSATGRRCASPFKLEVDHIKPVALGGSNDLSNLRIVCKTHNLFYAENIFGKSKMREFYRST